MNRGTVFFVPIAMLNMAALILTVSTIKIIIPIGMFLIPLSTFIFPITYFFGDVIAETYGYERTRLMLWSCFIGQWFFALILALLGVLCSHYNIGKDNFINHISGDILWLTFSNSAAIICGAFVNSYVICKLKINMHGKRFWLRSIKSTALGESVVTIVAGILAFNSTVPLAMLVNIIASAYLFKIVYGVLAAFPAQLLTKLLKKIEQQDIYDTRTDFNPFHLSLGQKKDGAY